MGEAMDKAKKNLGLVSPPGDSGGEREKKPDVMTELEAAINKVENIDARELLKSKARELRAESDLRTREAEDRARRLDGDGGGGGGDVDEKLNAKKDLIANALVLIEKGVSPEVVGRYLIASQGAQYPVNLGGGGGQGLTVADIKTIIDMVKGSGGADPQITTVLTALKEKIDNLKPADRGAPLDPVAMVKAQADAITSTIDSLVKAGLVVRPGTVKQGDAGESLESLKETHRHDEKMEEIKNERWYKEQLANTLSDLPERIGEGLAGRVAEYEETESGAPGPEFITCEDCQTKIPTSSAKDGKIECPNPKCHAIYSPKAPTAAGAK